MTKIIGIPLPAHFRKVRINNTEWFRVYNESCDCDRIVLYSRDGSYQYGEGMSTNRATLLDCEPITQEQYEVALSDMIDHIVENRKRHAKV